MINEDEIKPLTTAHLAALTSIHQAAFTNSAISQLGFEATRRYYEWLLTGPHPEAFRVGLFSREILSGFCFAGRFNGATAGFLRQNRLFLALRVISHPWLITNPIFRKRLALGLTILRRMQRRQVAPPIVWSELAKPSFGILAIATHPKWQGQGVGKQLMMAAEQYAQATGFRQMHLTVHPENSQAIRFYEGLSWHKEIVSGKWQGRMIKELQ